MTKEEAVNRAITVAKAEIGYHETPDNVTKYATDYDYDTRLYHFDMAGSPWCDYFFDWVMCEAFGFDTGKEMTYQYEGCAGAACACSANYYQNHGAYFQYPEVGDQVFFYSGGGINHTGIVESIEGREIVTIEGNSSDSVRENRYAVSNPTIAGYGRPKWDLVADEEAESYEIPQPDIPAEETPQAEPQHVHAKVQYMTGKYPLLTRALEDQELESVLALKAILQMRKIGAELEMNGHYDLATEHAVMFAQKMYGLLEDGECGKDTWLALIENG